MKRNEMLINGRWIRTERTFESLNPATGELFGISDIGDEANVSEAVGAARSALKDWRKRDVRDRANILAEAVTRLRSEYGSEGEPTRLKRLISDEMGKRIPEADIEVLETGDFVDYYVSHGPEFLQQRTLQLDSELWPTKLSNVVFEPVGVVAVIKPWNYPLELPFWSIAPALIAGNTIVFKPSENSSFVGTEIGRILHHSGIPAGVFNVVTGDGTTGKALVEADGIDMVSFTGSVPVGRDIAVACARRLRKYSLELGGNDVAIVCEDADLELAANGLVWGSFANSGQVCVRPKRVIVHRNVADVLIPKILERTQALRPGIDFGPIVNGSQLLSVETQVASAVADGATISVGGRRITDRQGFFFEPTILEGVDQRMSIMKEECFGPVMPIVVVNSDEEAVNIANTSSYGLGGSIWSQDAEKSAELASSLETGMVWVNDVNVAFPQAPWGGIKESGHGVELGEWGLQEYVVKKHISLEMGSDSRRSWWFPYLDSL